ncbi:hypothetical protein GOQ27_08505 [Clostridium sp. D2Q-11]|uniref:Uncharacterized protein n=1 Tax=Anaeromonas frigoriresistens TaxID=2683708 RepID=A0A942USU5_9FIRM|nr:hypothetical protein [Anaeromonas frigoriresistens]MBS4538503.1 hypothetical protein [Anaeromonas frigoriresistens]
MIKKILSSTLIMIMLGSTYTTAHSTNPINPTNVITIPNNNYKIIMPENNLVTSQKIILLSGKAEEDSSIIIKVYNFDELLSINKSKLNNDTSSIEEEPILTTKTEVGELGRYNIELKLPQGRNKIIVETNNDDNTYIFTRDISVTSEDIAKEYLSKANILNDVDIKELLKSIIESD